MIKDVNVQRVEAEKLFYIIIKIIQKQYHMNIYD